MTYKSYNELKNNTLNLKDHIIFKINNINYEYTVRPDYLNCAGALNNIIFEKLLIEDKYEFCDNIYGYPSQPGLFPECKHNDFQALTKIVLELFKLCDNYEYINESIWE